MVEVRSPLSAGEIKRQAEYRAEAVRPPKKMVDTGKQSGEVKTFKIDEEDLANRGNEEES